MGKGPKKTRARSLLVEFWHIAQVREGKANTLKQWLDECEPILEAALNEAKPPDAGAQPGGQSKEPT